jgi:hypothetical protein
VPEDSPSGADIAMQENVTVSRPAEEEKPQDVACSDFEPSGSKAVE